MSASGVKRQLPKGEFALLVVEEIKRLLLTAKSVEEVKAGSGFLKRDPTLLIRHHSLEEMVQAVEEIGRDAAAKFHVLQPMADTSKALALRAGSAGATAKELLQVYFELMQSHGIALGDATPFQLEADEEWIYLQAESIGDDPDGAPAWALRQDRDDQAFVAATSNLLAQVRRQGRAMTGKEQAAVANAYRLLERGVQLPPAFRRIGVSGYREHQTNLSLANPGDGHIAITCADSRLLEGTFVHVEHIDRDGVDDREKVEAYRLPAARNAARVRLHAGNAAACTAYIGRPVFENGVAVREGIGIYAPVDFEHDLLKSAHLIASAATAMFMNGIADCKIAIERMSAGQAIEFMRAVTGNTVRDPSRQYLSAAFNINVPVWDDRREAGKLVEARKDIGALGIELTLAGRFEKIAWDGASNQRPSVPVTEQLPSVDWLELVHRAHEQGLETYISAGMKPEHIRDCVYLGIDGVGIGTKLHYLHPQTGDPGQLNPAAVRATLEIRDAAALEVRGRAARLLAQLDRRYSEGTLTVEADADRLALYQALRDRDDGAALDILQRVALEPPHPEHEHPAIGRAQRLLRSAGVQTVGARSMGPDRWGARLRQVDTMLKAGDVEGIQEVLR